MELHANNHHQNLTLPGHRAYDLAHNCGHVTIGSHSTVICDQNTGHIFLGPDCKVVSCNHNRKFISVGANSIVERAHDNTGHLEIGAHSVLLDVHDNRGRITIGNHCKVPTSFHGNMGDITMGLHCQVMAAASNPSSPLLPCPSSPQPPMRTCLTPTGTPTTRTAPLPQMGFVVRPDGQFGQGSMPPRGPPYPSPCRK